MKEHPSHLRGAVAGTLILGTVVCGLYPLAVWAIGQAAFKDKANGSLFVAKDGTLQGSGLLGQNFTGPGYFHPRPSAAGANGYDAAGSGGSNLGPTSRKLADLIQARVTSYRDENGLAGNIRIPADAVTASASGLDPHISPANAGLQAARVARSRSLTAERLRELIRANTDEPFLGILGEPGVNVLRLNLALDALD